MGDEFFDTPMEQSRVKAEIVSRYFGAWSGVLRRAATNGLAYIDLFAGPGRYDDEHGTKSTPLRILEIALADEWLRNNLRTVFNDKNGNHVASLQNEVQALPGISWLRHTPIYWNEAVGENIASLFEGTPLPPTLSFVDPWGYQGLSLRLINAILKDFGSDCIFFFNYNRINLGLSNQAVKTHIDALFGTLRADSLRAQVAGMPSDERELTVVENLAEALREFGGMYVLPFRFVAEHQQRTSHHLVFVSKHVRGYEVMKDVMWRMSSTREQNVASFEYNRASAEQPLLFGLNAPLEGLAEKLTAKFPEQTLTTLDIYRRDHVGTPFVLPNYKEALRNLMDSGRISTDRKPRKGSFADDIRVTFPART